MAIAAALSAGAALLLRNCFPRIALTAAVTSLFLVVAIGGLHK